MGDSVENQIRKIEDALMKFHSNEKSVQIPEIPEILQPVYEEPVLIDRQHSMASTEALESESGIPRRYKEVTWERLCENNQQIRQIELETTHEKIKKYIESLGKNIEQGRGLILRGNNGTGKTTYAVAIAKVAISMKYSTTFIAMASMVDVFQNGNRDEKAALNCLLKRVSLLILDDLGFEYDQDWIRAKIQALINERYNEMKATIFTTNLVANGAIGERYGRSIMDRLQETCGIVNFKGYSYRAMAADQERAKKEA